MDTRTRTASPTAGEHVTHPAPPLVPDKISAYYSLVFPHYTFYIQTLSITIGRRCATNAASSSTAEHSQVDVDLGALKSVSRLHARIEYDQDEDRFVLVVIGRNGAWVDGVWSGAGTRAPLGERSQIQIASRTFHFILPPPPPPEDSPSPSSQSSANRPRSPSVDITSISPPSSQPSHSPPPAKPKLRLPLPPPAVVPKAKPKSQPQPPPPSPQLPNSNSIGKATKVNSKKRKKNDIDPSPVLERPKPEDMPPKPPFTYAQLIYRAIKDTSGKATLQEICAWIMNTHEYYRYADGAWMSSVRHNLSSSRAFLKMERCGGDRGKGFFWSIDEKHAKALEEQELKSQEAAASGNIIGAQDTHGKGRKKEKGSSMLEPPLKRSIKGDLKGTPLPPPLTSSPLPLKLGSGSSTSGPPTTQTPQGGTTGVFAYPSLHPSTSTPQQQPSSTIPYPASNANDSNPYAALTQPHWSKHPSHVSAIIKSPSSIPTPNQHLPTPGMQTTSPESAILSTPQTSGSVQHPPPGQVGVPDVVIPIILGPIPPTHPDYAPNHPNNSAKEGYMVLHERRLILDPDVFSELTKEMLEQLEKMGARAALGVLAGHMVRALKERRARERSKAARKPRGAGVRSGMARKAPPTPSTPFTNVPLEHKSAVTGASAEKLMETVGSLDAEKQSSTSLPGAAIPTTSSANGTSQTDPGSPLIVVDDSEDEGPATKKRKIDES